MHPFLVLLICLGTSFVPTFSGVSALADRSDRYWDIEADKNLVAGCTSEEFGCYNERKLVSCEVRDYACKCRNMAHAVECLASCATLPVAKGQRELVCEAVELYESEDSGEGDGSSNGSGSSDGNEDDDKGEDGKGDDGKDDDGEGVDPSDDDPEGDDSSALWNRARSAAAWVSLGMIALGHLVI